MNQFHLGGRRVWVAGNRGMVGSALVRRLETEDCRILTSEGVDLRRQAEVEGWMAKERPDAIFMAAAKVGGILANDTRPAEFLYDNILIEANIVEAAHQHKVAKLLMLGSSCIYPRLAPQPISEEMLLTGPLEKTNEAYAIAKIAGIELCRSYRRQFNDDFISVMPTNLYGPGDNFDLTQSHVLPSLLRKAHEAKIARDPSVLIWGTGEPRREFMHVDDLADACVFLMKSYSAENHINVGTGVDLTIRELSELIFRVVGYVGELKFDLSKPNGTPRKLLDVEKLHGMGWRHKIGLEEGIRRTYAWFLEHKSEARMSVHSTSAPN